MCISTIGICKCHTSGLSNPPSPGKQLLNIDWNTTGYNAYIQNFVEVLKKL
jgi:hypothetical protein